MKLVSVPKILCLLFCWFCFCSQGQTIQAIQATKPDTEVRALWVVRTTLTSPEKIHQLVKAAAENGFNTLIVQIRGRGDAYYKSRVEPPASELKDQPVSFDPLALTLTEAHK